MVGAAYFTGQDFGKLTDTKDTRFFLHVCIVSTLGFFAATFLTLLWHGPGLLWRYYSRSVNTLSLTVQGGLDDELHIPRTYVPPDRPDTTKDRPKVECNLCNVMSASFSYNDGSFETISSQPAKAKNVCNYQLDLREGEEVVEIRHVTSSDPVGYFSFVARTNQGRTFAPRSEWQGLSVSDSEDEGDEED